MEFVTLNEILPHAEANKYAIAQFNINGILWLQAVLEVANKERTPVIIGATDRIIDKLGGFDFIVDAVKDICKQLAVDIPVVLHLDHGKDFERCKAAIDAGFSSVMFDGSHLPISENIRITKEVVCYARRFNVSVEGEVGTVGGNEDGVIGGIKYASVKECVQLVQETKIDCLAAALGSVHGEYVGKPQLGFKEMQEIHELVKIPLVLHGASGILDDQIRQAIELGHAKININTELNQAWAKGVNEYFAKNPNSYAPQDLFDYVRVKISEAVVKKIRLFGLKTIDAG